jgi:hypothetical protein
MDYTTLALVKQAMDSKETVQDTVLSSFITRASRYLDKLCTSQSNVANYFMTETVNAEILTNGVIDFAGRLAVFPHKPVITAVSAIAYRYSLRQNWIDGDPLMTALLQDMVVFEGYLPSWDQGYVKISYTGGLGLTVTDLPEDLVDLATTMTIRLYKEARTGLGDSIGVAELGMLVYTKAFPQRVLDMLNVANYARIAPWT